ncbi:MAG: bifunctional riboflavin kinase/FAD synthetase [Deltaproteobacteria bacterium]|nr:bifunctional riboflavin kinase/FAD synthetase [Deltaproteobacteria bacterium]
MRNHLGLATAIGRLTRGSIAIGNFDGVHLGHQALFAAARRGAAQRGGPVCALTFEPHPARVLQPQMAPPLVCTHARKLELLAAQGVTELVEQPFDAAFAATEAQAFVELLCATGVAEVVVGQDFTYGKGRTGRTESLRGALEERGVHLTLIPPVEESGVVVSSTKIRQLVLEGKVDLAQPLLGRAFDVTGEVVKGAGRGRTLGWPTANVRTSNELMPALGVYATQFSIGETSADGTVTFGPPHLGAANLGLNPTFTQPGSQQVSLEVFVLDFAGDLYGKTVRVEFVKRLRAERKFPGLDALRAQITADVEQVRALLGGDRPR